MECKNSNFWIGFGIGSIIGVLVYRFSSSVEGQQLRDKACQAFHKAGEHAEEILDTAKGKVLDTGKKMADKVADGTFEVAKKANDLKKRVHTLADEARK